MRIFQIESDWGMENLKLGKREVPRPGRGQVLLRMKAASLNARDLIVPERGYGRATGELPLIPLSDGVGEVVSVGPDVGAIQPGERVCPTFFQAWGDGAPSAGAFASALGGPPDGVMAEYVCLDQRGVVPVPDYLSDAEAACLPFAGVTAWNAISTLGHTAPGDRVLVQGTGSVALFALAFAKLHGAHVTVISSSDDKLARVEAMGADQLINYRRVEDWARASRSWTADRGGFDHVIELGGEKTLPLSLKAVRPGGTISMIGVLSGLQMNASLGAIVTRQIRLQGVTVGSRGSFEAMVQALKLHLVRPVIGEQFAFEDLHPAMARMREADRFGKTVIAF